MKKLLFSIILLVCSATRSFPLEEHFTSYPETYPFSIVFENDIFGGTDRGYTNGFVMSLSMPWREEGKTKNTNLIFNITDSLSLISSLHREKRTTYSIGQTMITPENIQEKELIVDDVPYSGLLFGRINVEYQNRTQAEVLGLVIGVVGPSSKAEETQSAIHHIVGSEDPEGWDNQLHDELAVNINYDHKWKILDTFPQRFSWDSGYDGTFYAGTGLGNINTDVRCGGILRFGNGANKFPSILYKGGVESVPDIGYRTDNPLVLVVTLGAELSYKFYAISLDGNMDGDSHEVERVPLGATLFAGVGMGYKRFRFGFTMVRSTKQFKSQSGTEEYGSVTLGWIF